MSFGASLADLEAIAPDPRLWYKHGGALAINASSLTDLGLLPHAILPLLCLVPATVAAVRYATRGRYEMTAVAACLVLVSQAYHHCRLAGHGHLSLLGAPMTDVTCNTWRQIDVLALMTSISFVAANVVGLADWRIITIAATALPAKAVHLTMLAEDSKYHQIVHTLFWWVFIVVANPLMARHSLDGGIKDLDSALHPDLRKRDPLPRVIMPFVIAVFCFVAPCLGANFIGDPAIYWPSMWGCHAAIGVSMCGILGAEVQSVADKAMAAKQAATPEVKTPRQPHQRIAPMASGKPIELSDKCRKRLSSKLSEVAKDLVEQHQQANIELTKIRVTGNARVEIIEECGDMAARAQDEPGPKFFGGETPSEDDAIWAPSYEFQVELDIGVSYGEGFGLRSQKPASASKVTKRRAKGHCSFGLSESIGSNDAEMTITLRAASSINSMQGTQMEIGPTDTDGHNAARKALTEVAAHLRARLPSFLDQMEKDMLLAAVGDTFYALG